MFPLCFFPLKLSGFCFVYLGFLRLKVTCFLQSFFLFSLAQTCGFFHNFFRVLSHTFSAHLPDFPRVLSDMIFYTLSLFHTDFSTTIPEFYRTQTPCISPTFLVFCPTRYLCTLSEFLPAQILNFVPTSSEFYLPKFYQVILPAKTTDFS